MSEQMIEEEKREPFVVTDDQKAEWCLKQIRQKKQELEVWQKHYENLLAAVEFQIEKDIAYFEGSLEAYFRSQQAEGFTKKADTQESYKLPSGKLVLKRQQPEFGRDEDKLIPWLRQNSPEFIKTKESVNWDGLKKTLFVNGEGMITEDGEVVPGITVTKRDDIFKVEVK